MVLALRWARGGWGGLAGGRAGAAIEHESTKKSKRKGGGQCGDVVLAVRRRGGGLARRTRKAREKAEYSLGFQGGAPGALASSALCPHGRLKGGTRSTSHNTPKLVFLCFPFFKSFGGRRGTVGFLTRPRSSVPQVVRTQTTQAPSQLVASMPGQVTSKCRAIFLYTCGFIREERALSRSRRQFSVF